MSKLAKYRTALMAAKPIIADDLQREIECHATPEAKMRRGSVKGYGKSFFNEDTIDDLGARREIRECRRVLKLIEAALTLTNNTP